MSTVNALLENEVEWSSSEIPGNESSASYSPRIMASLLGKHELSEYPISAISVFSTSTSIPIG
jgi:hypothetical protein